MNIYILGGNAYRMRNSTLESAPVNADNTISLNDDAWAEVQEIDLKSAQTLSNYFGLHIAPTKWE